jgi:hypothetical protein
MRIALVADRYVNPPPGGLDGLAVLAPAGWGVMQLPAEDYPAQTADRMLAEIAEQMAEFRQHGYEFVLIGEPGRLAAALAAFGLPMPDQIIPATSAELAGFLAARPAPVAAHWARLAAGQPPAGGEATGGQGSAAGR